MFTNGTLREHWRYKLADKVKDVVKSVYACNACRHKPSFTTKERYERHKERAHPGMSGESASDRKARFYSG